MQLEYFDQHSVNIHLADHRKMSRKKKLSSKRKLLWRRSRSEESEDRSVKADDVNNRAESAEVRCCYARRRSHRNRNVENNLLGNNTDKNGFLNQDSCSSCRRKNSKKFFHKASSKSCVDKNEDENFNIAGVSSHSPGLDPAKATSTEILEQELKKFPRRKSTRRDKLNHSDAFEEDCGRDSNIIKKDHTYKINKDVFKNTDFCKCDNKSNDDCDAADQFGDEKPFRSESVPADLALSVDKTEEDLNEIVKSDENVEDDCNSDDAFILNPGIIDYFFDIG